VETGKLQAVSGGCFGIRVAFDAEDFLALVGAFLRPVQIFHAVAVAAFNALAEAVFRRAVEIIGAVHVLFHADAVQQAVGQAQIDFRDIHDVTVVLGQIQSIQVELRRLQGILFQQLTHAGLVHVADPERRCDVALFGGVLKQRQRRGLVFFDALAAQIAVAQQTHRLDIAEVRGFAEEAHGLLEVRGPAQPGVIGAADGQQRFVIRDFIGVRGFLDLTHQRRLLPAVHSLYNNSLRVSVKRLCKGIRKCNSDVVKYEANEYEKAQSHISFPGQNLSSFQKRDDCSWRVAGSGHRSDCGFGSRSASQENSGSGRRGIRGRGLQRLGRRDRQGRIQRRRIGRDG